MELAAFLAERLNGELKQQFQREVADLRGEGSLERSVVLQKQDSQSIQQEAEKNEVQEKDAARSGESPAGHDGDQGAPVPVIAWSLLVLLILSGTWVWRRANV